FLNGGTRCYVVNVPNESSISSGEHPKSGLALLEKVDEVTIVCTPGYTNAATYEAVINHCEALKDRVGILDAPSDVDSEKIDSLTKFKASPSRVSGDNAPTDGSDQAGSVNKKIEGPKPKASDIEG